MKSWSIAVRSLVRRPLFAATAVLTLAFGIAATTTMFSVVDTVLVKPLPFPDADRLVAVMETNPAMTQRLSLLAPGRLEEWQAATRAFTLLSGSYAENLTDTSGDEPERLNGRRVAPRFFAVYGMRPAAGRLFTADEERNGGARAAIISDGLWQRRYGRDANAVGRRLVLGGAAYTIVGVMPAAFGGGSVVGGASAEVWLPAQFFPGMLTYREARFLTGVGRMKPGVTIAQATDDLARVQAALGERYPATDKGWSASVTDLKTQRIGDYGRALWLAFAAVALLLAIAIANIAGLLLVQLHRRARELAVRQAIGGSRGQIVGAVMTEVAIIAVVGSIAGAAAAFALVRLFATVFSTVPRMNELALDARGLAFAIAASVLAALVFGLWPTLTTTRGNLAPALAEGGRGSSTGRHRLQRALVAAQIALSVVLLASAGLVLRSYDNLSRVDLGFDAGNAIAFHVGAAWDEDRPRIGRLQIDLLSEIERLPGVVAAGSTNFLPATGATLRYQVTLDRAGAAGDNGKITAGSRMISRGYLTAIGASLVAGAWCPALHADFRAPRKVMVNRAFADRYGPDLVGRTLRPDQAAMPHEIVGIVGDLAEDGPAASAAPYVYTCSPAGSWPDPEYVVRTTGDTRALMPAIRAIVHRLDATRAIFGVRSIDAVLAGALDQPRLNARMLTLFAAAAMALASLGLYSLLMLLVSERTREMGVRMALGAAPAEVARLVLAGAGRLLATGVVVGLILTAAVGRVLRAVLFGVSPLDGATLGAALLVLAVVTLAAAAVPARRAASLDPIEAIRTE